MNEWKNLKLKTEEALQKSDWALGRMAAGKIFKRLSDLEAAASTVVLEAEFAGAGTKAFALSGNGAARVYVVHDVAGASMNIGGAVFAPRGFDALEATIAGECEATVSSEGAGRFIAVIRGAGVCLK